MGLTRCIILGLVLAALVGCSGTSSASPAAPREPSSSPAETKTTVTHSQTTDIPCDVDLTFSGGIVGHVTGSQPGQATRTGPEGRDIGISAYFKVPGVDGDGFISLTVSTKDGLWAMLTRTDTGEFGVWYQSQNPGTATISPDGSRASVAITVGGAKITVPVHVVGTMACPQVRTF